MATRGMHTEELIYLTANVRGIKFYDGYEELLSSNGFLHVRLVKEPNNPHDCNAVLVVASVKIWPNYRPPREICCSAS